jgi:heme o synthase
MRLFLDLTKSKIIVFVLLTGTAGYALGLPIIVEWDWALYFLTLLSLYFFSAGSFALNQAQEVAIDEKMPRTVNRPIPSGKISRGQAYFLGFAFVALGIFVSSFVNQTVLITGLATVFLYNVMYTLYWKKKWAFGAVPGAIPGAMPFVIGYAGQAHTIFTPTCVYGFMIMFLWQMPHFWALAIKYKDDYALGGIPVLPTRIGTSATLYHIGLYTFCYVGLAIASPWFTRPGAAYLIFVLPAAFKVLYEFLKYYKSEGRERWLGFFLWVNFSMLIFLAAPVVDRVIYFFQVKGEGL